jgi:hypothetical protein
MKALSHPACETVPGDPDLQVIESAPPDGMAAAIDALAIDSLPNFRLEGPVKHLTDWLESVAQAPGLVAAQRFIVADVAARVRYFADRSGSTTLALKLEIVRDNACRKLHHDHVAYRLVCTYRGPGTQWLPRIHEPALGDERVAVPDDWLESIPRFASALFAGCLLAGAVPVLHRSPQIAGTGAVRLVLTINEPYAGRLQA